MRLGLPRLLGGRIRERLDKKGKTVFSIDVECDILGSELEVTGQVAFGVDIMPWFLRPVCHRAVVNRRPVAYQGPVKVTCKREEGSDADQGGS